MAGTIVVGTIQSESNGDIDLAPNGTGLVEVRGNTNAGSIKLNCENNSHGVTIKSPAHSASATYTLTLPTSNGDDGEVLKTDGNGVLAWVAQPTAGASVSAENTWTAGQRGEITTLTSGTTLTIDFDASNNFQVALGHNVTTVAIQNATVGQAGSIFLAQPTSGSTTHTVGGWNSAFKFPGATAPTLSTAINKVDRVDYVIRAADQIHVVATLDMAV